MSKLFLILVILTSFSINASDWGGSTALIEKMYVYPNAVIVVQGDVYSGKAGCDNNNKWSFYWSSFSPEVADRVYSSLLSAYMAKVPVKPIFHSTECGPENDKQFTGSLVL